jgi:hypothetical protein
MAVGDRMRPDLSYRTGVKCRILFPNDFNHLFSVLSGGPKVEGFEKPSKTKAIADFFKFFENDLHYFFLSKGDPLPGIFYIAEYIYRNVGRKASSVFGKFH